MKRIYITLLFALLFSTGAPKGNQNAFKHGFYSAEMLAHRQIMRELLRDSQELIDELL